MMPVCPICGVRKKGMADHCRDKHGIRWVDPRTARQRSKVERVVLEMLQEANPAGTLVRLKGLVFNQWPLTCPGCSAPMVLKWSTQYDRPFYSCSRYPDCREAHGAHPDGEPLGIPANKDTKALRQNAHAVFDRLWKPGPRKQFPARVQAYAWMQKALNLDEDEAHIAMFDQLRCKRLIEAVWQEFGDGQDLDF